MAFLPDQWIQCHAKATAGESSLSMEQVNIAAEGASS